MTDKPSDDPLSRPAPQPAPGQSGPGAPPARGGPRRPVADDFQPDVPAEFPIGTVAPPAPPRRLATDSTRGSGREPPVLDAPHESALESTPPDDAHLTPGAGVGGGRYRLLVFHGGAPALQFWQALDTALDRQVALTFVDPDQTMPEGQLHEILSRTMRLSRVDLPGIARVLDVVRTGAGGLVVSEWVRGASLQEVAGTSPSPVGAARAMRSLAAAAEAAHHAGVALSIDHPSRVRVSIEGDVTLAFPATMPDTSPEDDIRGIGAVLYALLVNRWPLPDSGAGCGLAPAERDAVGQPVNPDVVDPLIPFQIAAAAHSIQADGGIRSASTLLNLLQQATAVAERTDLLGPIDEAPPPRPPTPPDAATRLRRRRSVMIGAGVGAVIMLVALGVLASVLNRIFGDVNGLDKGELGLGSPSATSSQDSSAAAGTTVKPLQATVFSPGGEADRPQDAGLAIDGNPATSWSTDTYHDPVPFPNFKNGVGLMLQLPKPTVVGTVTMTVSSTGTRVEIRSSPNPNPARLEDTKALTQPKPLQPGSNRITVNASSPTSNLLVWISTMGTTNGESRCEVSEITVQAAS